MPPLIGVYPLWEHDLFYFLGEFYPHVGNTQLLKELVVNCLHSLVPKEGTNLYIAKERYRAFGKRIEDAMSVGLPPWEEFMEDGNPRWEPIMEELEGLLFSREPDWLLFGDDPDILYSILDSSLGQLDISQGAGDVVTEVLTATGAENIEEVYLAVPSDNRLYVFKSPQTGPRRTLCVDQSWDAPKLPLGDASGPEGDYLTWVLPTPVINEIVEWSENS